MINKILYILFVATTLYISILYDYSTMRFLLAFEIALPVYLAVLLQIMKRLVTVELICDSTHYTRDERITYLLRVDNRSIFPIPKIKVAFSATNTISRNFQEERKEYGIDSRKENTFRCTYVDNHCGVVTVKLKEVRMFDYLKLFSVKLKNDQTIDIKVMPYIKAIPLAVEENVTEQEDRDDYPVKTVSSSGEMIDIRSFQPGDTLKHVHWKVTARKDELHVKDYGSITIDPVTILLDCRKTDIIDNYDVFMDVSASLSYSMAQKRILHQIIWNGESGWNKIIIKDERDSTDFIERLVELQPHEQVREEQQNLYGQLVPEHEMRKTIKLDTGRQMSVQDNEIFLTDELLEHLEEWNLTL